ncbi:hypothetical protein [Treponema sp.]|uniref:hypothetical protein n=1 Tax=Treponema sp. TaxID=166 RepID=UPI00298E4741|nr:hypothetical protein [Treponema sp.]
MDLKFYAVAAIALLTIIYLLNFYINRQAHKEEAERQRLQKKRNEAAKKGLLVSCPLCNTMLLPGEDLVSRVYRPMNVPDQLCTINGCPHCYPAPEPGLKRICPVCHKTVPLKDGHLIARLFNKSGGKKHVIVTGCTECSKGVK